MNTLLDPETQARYRELASWLARLGGRRRCPIVGINGAQGSGKSTAAAFLKEQLREVHGLKAAVLSLDDFYLPRAARQRLATEVHPLLATRGVPGTHDVALGISIGKALREQRPGERLALPRFSKAEDERWPEAGWPWLEGQFDLLLFEGWCVGLPAQSAIELLRPVNALETHEDADGRWRHWVNEQLGTAYADWFAMLDALIFLQVPDFSCVSRWRGQQELETAAAAGASAIGLQSPVQLERFIQHYQRLTMHALRVMPALADALLSLGDDHRVMALRFRER